MTSDKIKSKILISLVLVLALGNVQCANILSPFAKETEDAALLEEAKKDMNDLNWSDAIGRFSSMTSTYRAKREVKYVEASAYGGRCGFGLLSFIKAFEDIGSDNLFLFLWKTYKGATAQQVADCQAAETLIRSIGTTANRTTKENTLAAFLGFVSIGKALGEVVPDANADDVPDWGNDDSCTAAAQMTSAQAKASMASLIFSLLAFAEGVSGGTAGTTTVTDALCGDSPIIAGLCDEANADPSGIDGTEENSMRTLIQEGQVMGMGTCTAVPNDVANCLCL